MLDFTHLHVHSTYSILDGMSPITALVDKAIEAGMHSIALTDHGNMFGIKHFFDYVNEVNRPIQNEIKTIRNEIDKMNSENENHEKLP